MSRPLIPEIYIPEFPLIGEWTIKPFGALVALGVCIGWIITLRIGKARGIPPEAMSRFLYWVMVFAFLFGHVLDAAFYHPYAVRKDPMVLLRLWDGLSSFGGFIGALIGVFAFKWKYGVKNVMPFVDTMGAAFPVGWFFGRMGCAAVHDHPGIKSDLWFAVAFPEGGRFDLGLYEMVFALIVAIVCMALARRPRPPGFFTGFTMLVYAPVRFSLDFLRASYGSVAGSDPRYLSLTPAQWGSIVMAMAGFIFLWRAASSNEVGTEPFKNAVLDADPSLRAA